jgi:hypothetical protein
MPRFGPMGLDADAADDYSPRACAVQANVRGVGAMAKSKQQRAFFEILAKERGLGAAKPAGPPKPAPVVQPAAGPRVVKPAPVPEPRPQPAPGASPAGLLAGGRLTLTYYQVAVAVMAAVLVCAIALVAGMYFGRGGEPPLPPTQPKPTMEEVRKGPVTGGLVKPGPDDTAVGGAEHPAEPAPAPSGGRAEEPRPPAGPPAPGEAAGRLRLRIARLETTRAAYTDRLRQYLAQNGVGTDLVARRGYQFLYGTARFEKESDEKAVAYKKKVVALLKAFEQQTNWQTATDVYFVAVE